MDAVPHAGHFVPPVPRGFPSVTPTYFCPTMQKARTGLRRAGFRYCLCRALSFLS